MTRRLIAILLGAIIVVVLVVLIGSGALLMLSSSSTDTSFSFNSPSNARTIRLIETCRDNACTHQAVISQATPDGGTLDIRCGLDIAADRPVFISLELDWLPDESGVMIRYGLTETVRPAYTLDFARDCNA